MNSDESRSEGPRIRAGDLAAAAEGDREALRRMLEWLLCPLESHAALRIGPEASGAVLPSELALETFAGLLADPSGARDASEILRGQLRRANALLRTHLRGEPLDVGRGVTDLLRILRRESWSAVEVEADRRALEEVGADDFEAFVLLEWEGFEAEGAARLLGAEAADLRARVLAVRRRLAAARPGRLLIGSRSPEATGGHGGSDPEETSP